MRENHSNKKWYKLDIPKAERKGLSNKEISMLRIKYFYKGRK